MNAFGRHMGDYTENSSKMGWLVSILELGAWLGTLYSGFLAEIFSRKYAILVNTAIFILGVVIQSTAITSAGHNAILAGRFITGKFSCLSTNLRGVKKKLTRRRYGCRFAIHDRTDVQCRVCAARNPRRHGRHATDGYHHWYNDRFLDRLW
jgi:MFS-type transporter involved in bile tolerance (Atg22 family)